MPAQTKFDLYQSAHKAANATLGVASSYTLENSMLEAFNADGNDPADFDFWRQQFATLRANMLNLKQQPSPSAAAKASSAAAAKSATAGSPAPAQPK